MDLKELLNLSHSLFLAAWRSELGQWCFEMNEIILLAAQDMFYHLTLCFRQLMPGVLCNNHQIKPRTRIASKALSGVAHVLGKKINTDVIKMKKFGPYSRRLQQLSILDNQ